MHRKLISLVCFLGVLGLIAGVTKGGLTDGLVGYWPLDGDAKDASGNGNDGVIMGNVTPTADRFGNPDSAMNFPGNVNNYIDLEQPPTLLIKGAMSVAAWVRADTMMQNGRIIAKQGPSSGRSWSIQLESAGGFARFDVGVNPTDRIRADSEPLSFGPDEWFHIAGVFRPGQAVELYLNGELVKSEPTTVTEQWIENGLPLNIGRRPQPGTPWQGDIDEVRMYSRALAPAEVRQVMAGREGGVASNPSPADEAVDVPRDVVLGWTPGEFAPPVKGHKVYLSDNFNDVNDGIGGIAQDANSYASGRLDFGTTYYWRVDEVNGPPDFTVYKGSVWSFTTEPIGYPIENITVAASSAHSADMGPEKTINGSGLDANDLHSIEPTDMWLSGSEPLGAWIEFQFDKVYKLYEMWVWNSNQTIEPLVGFGLKDITIEYSTNGTDYTTLGTTHEFAQAPGAAGYVHNTTVDFSGVAAKYVRITAQSNWGGLPQYGLSEVRFFYVPVRAREPSPDSGSTDVAVDVTLGWRAGREAAQHDVYLGSDEQTVIEGTTAVSTVTEASYGPLSLDLGRTYYWKINEINMAETPTSWESDVWSFTTPEFLLVDDFESYNDLDPDDPGSNRIFSVWLDGWQVPTNGSVVGYENPPFCERTLVHGGEQSMPLFYSDTGGAAYSEAELPLSPAQDWTKAGIATLVLYFHGAAGNTGQLYVKVNGSKVVYGGDAADIAKPRWAQWNIDLSSVGTSLQKVTKLSIGIDGAGAAGTLYVDDIRLYQLAPELEAP